MINKFFHEYGAQKAAWIHEKEITNESSTSIKVLSQNEDILRNRIVRTFLKRDTKTQALTSYNFNPATFKQYLMVHDAIIPFVITQNDKGDFVLMFSTDNQVAAFLEAYPNGLEIKGTTVYFKKVGYRDLGEALQTIKALTNKAKSERKKRKKAWIVRQFPRNMDDNITCGGLLQPKNACSIDMTEIFHSGWYQESLRPFPLEAKPLTLDNNDESQKKYYEHLKCLNTDIWEWYSEAIPTAEEMRKIQLFLSEYVLKTIHKTLNLSNNRVVGLNNIMTIFGSASYGLFISPFSDIDVGVNLNIVGKRANNKEKSLTNAWIKEKHKKAQFLRMLSTKIQNNYANIFKKIMITQQKEAATFIEDKDTNDQKNKRWRFRRPPKRDVVVHEEVFTARVPLLKLYIPPLKVFMDISINNESNFVSKLIMLYVKYDIRVRPFLCALKYWCYQRSICKAFKGYLNTFGWVLLGIKLLQNGLEIPILPLMKMDVESGAVMINKENMKENETNSDTVAELLYFFFDFYAHFDFSKYQISILVNERYQLKESEENKINPSYRSEWIVFHPLKAKCNVAYSVKQWTAHLMKKQLRIASNMILQSNWETLTDEIGDESQAFHIDPEYECSVLLFRNLRYDVNERQVEKFVSRVAKPISVVISRYKSGRHIGKGYVAFETAHIAHKVMAELNGNLLLGRTVYILFAPMESIDAAAGYGDAEEKDDDVDMNLKSVKFTNEIKLIGYRGKNQSDGLLLDLL